MLTRSTGADSRMSMAQQSVIKERYYDESDHCQICRLRGKRRTATFFCTNCNMPVCSFCGDQHKATDVTATHDVIPKKHQDGSVATCGIHKSYAVQYYCESCAQLICVNCTMIDHRNHNIVDIQIKVEECKSRLKDTVSELDQKIHQFDRELRKMSDIEIGIEHNRENIRDDVTRKVEALKRRIDEQHQAVLSQLDKYLNGKMDLLQKKKEVVQKRFDEMMAVRVSMDVNRADVVQGEKFITNVVKIMRQVAQFRPPREVDVKDFTGIAFVMTNNDEVGIIEETGKPMIVPQGKRIKHAEKMDHVMLHPANRKVSETVKAMQPGAREWHTLPDSVEFRRISLNNEDFSNGQVVVTFDPLGAASDHSITCRDEDDGHTVLVDGTAAALNVSMATNYLETIRMMASVGLGWTVLPRSMHDGSLHILPVRDAALSRTLGYVYHRGRSLSRAAQAFIDRLEQFSDY